MDSTIKPLFIFSLPRSGSTLLQKILASHEDIATVSEPWILLPYLFTLKKQGVYSEYGHIPLVVAIEDFCKELPNGRDDYLDEIRSLTLRLYNKAAKKQARYFIDKTPRYYLIVEEIINLFPEAKFVFLWRNPLSVVASTLNTWAKGKWTLYYFLVDLFDGISNLTTAYEKYNDIVYTMQYEKLLTNTEYELKSLFNYLELPFNSRITSDFTSTQLQGRHGDPTGQTNYQSLNKEPLEKWKLTLNNPIRKTWCRYYLEWIGEDRLAVMNYELDDLLNQLNNIPSSFKYINTDLSGIIYGIVHEFITLTLTRRDASKFPTLRMFNKK